MYSPGSSGSRRSSFSNYDATRNGQDYPTTDETQKLLSVTPEDEYKKPPRNCSFFGFLFSLLPFLTWLPKYKWRRDLPHDLVSGFTVAVMHIPQGMAYGLLAGVPPVVGIYTGFFPVLLYTFLGTMPHVSMGTFAVVSILVSKPVLKLGHATHNLNQTSSNITAPGYDDMSSEIYYDRVTVLSAVCLMVGFLQVGMGLVRLGSFVAVLLTDTVISAFTVGASFHVLTSQIKHVLGIKLVKQVGPGRLIFTYFSLAEHIQNTNHVTALLSLACFIFLVVVDKIVSKPLKKLCVFPLPSQLFLVVVTTAMATPLELSCTHAVRIISDIGAIPSGLPPPIFPPLELIPQVFVDSIPPAIIGYVIGQGLGTMFATKHGYTVDPNQELLAQGASNVLGSLFQCIPIAGSLSRSAVQEASGCKSMMTSIVSCSLLLLVLMWLGPLFSSLPVCVLATVILASLTGIVAKVADVRRFMKRSMWDGAVWLVTFAATVLLDVDLGLVVGVAASLAAVLLRSCVPHVMQLQDPRVESACNSKVVAVVGPLHFLSAGYCQFRISRTLGLGSLRPKSHTMTYKTIPEVNTRHLFVVLDLSGVTFLDNTGAKALIGVATLVQSSGGTLALAAPNKQVMEALENNKEAALLDMYPTYLDALQLMQYVSY